MVHIDASEVSLGAVLSQVWAGEEHLVTYISRKLLASERAYSTVEKEALAIKWTTSLGMTSALSPTTHR